MTKIANDDFYCQELISGKTLVNKIYESKKVLAFYHTKPSYQVHIVIVPKEHVKDLLSLNDKHNALILEVLDVAKKIASTLSLEQGIRLTTNIGKFQDTPHLHFHLISGQKK